MNVYEEDRYPFLKDEDLFIKEAIQRGKKVLGICLGAQLIVKALGAKVFKAPVKEIGWVRNFFNQHRFHGPVLFSTATNVSGVSVARGYFRDSKGWKLIATSEFVVHQAFRYGENAYGLQFHLEVTEEMIQEWMKSCEEDLRGSQPSLFSKLKILTDTEMQIETYTRRGMKFLRSWLFAKSSEGE